MEQNFSEIKLIDLTHSSISLNETNDFNSSIQSISSKIVFPPKNLQSQPSAQYHLLTISFDLIQFNPLTPLQQQIILFQLYDSEELQIKSHLRLSKLFELHTLSYFMQIQTAFFQKKFSQNGYTTVKTQNFNTYLKHHIQINFPSIKPFISMKQCQSALLLGNKQNKWSFAVQNFKVISTTTQTETVFPNEQQKPIIKNLSLPHDYSYPLIDKLELPLSQEKINLLQKISQLQPYSAPKVSQKSEQQFYICHDMKGGYIQDINTFNPIRSDNLTHHYRFDYLNQTKIFNYFSHYPITIPPKMWRQLCKKYNVLCLGTFIVEPNELAMDQNDFLKKQFALKLVYIAKKAQFDGYLINIQVPVQDPVKVISWLDLLTKQINKAIPGSQIVWYDSIVINGQIAYQNQLNPYNKAFYQMCNGIFTNYWWKQQSLLTSLKHKIPQKSIYIGNDCFGRNTYAGGKYEILNAVKKIQQIGKGSLTPALFAPGFTYEDEGQKIRQKFNQNEIKMYHGSNIDSRKIQKWKITQNGGQGWKQEGDWFVTSHDMCKKQALVKISDYKGNPGTLTIKFSCFVAGTGPKFDDYYKIVLQVLDYKNNIIYMESAYPSTKACEKQQYVEVKLEIECSLITDNVCARVMQEGKDAQVWAGHYGSRFKGETVALILSNNQRKWISSIPISPVNLIDRYTTFFNKGEGDYFYWMGNKTLPKYCSLSDFDIPPVLTLNNISTVEISYADSFIGGTCLKFQDTDRIVLNSFHLSNAQSNQRKFTALIVTKGTEPKAIACGNLKGVFKQFIDTVKLQFGWKSYISELVFTKQESNFTTQVQFSNKNGLIGQFSLFEKSILEKNPLQFHISFSKQSKHLLPYHFDFILNSTLQTINSNIPSKLLLKFGDFTGFINLQKITSQKENQNQTQTQTQVVGLLKNIPVISHKVQELQLQLLDITGGIHKILIQKLISKQQLKELLQNKPFTLNFNM